MASKGRILVVDDTPASLRLLSEILKDEGHEVRSAINGEVALGSAIVNPPELVLLDIRMPGMDGFEVCRRLKAEPGTRDVPVIFISALSDTVDKVQGFALGAVDFVTKPFQREELLARVRTHLEVYRLRNNLEALVEERTLKYRESEERVRMSLLELEAANESLRESEADLTIAQEIAHLGSWQGDLSSNQLTASDEWRRIFGIPHGAALTVEAFYACVHPDDRDAVHRAWAEGLQAGDCDFEHRIEVDGDTKWVRQEARFELDAAGRAVRAFGSAQDITERKLREERIGRLARLQAEAAGLGQAALRGATLTDMLDDAATRVAGGLGVEYSSVSELQPNREAFLLRAGVGWKDGFVGRSTVDRTGSQPGYAIVCDGPVIEDDVATETRFAPLPNLLGEDVASSMSVVISTAEGPYGAISAHSRRRRAFTPDEVNFLQTIANVLGMAIDRQRHEVRLRRVNRAYRALSKGNEALVRATDEVMLLQQICQIIIDEAGYRLCWVGYAQQDAARTVRPMAHAGFEDEYLQSANITWDDTEPGQGPTGLCIRTGQIQIVKDMANDPRLGPWRAEALRRGYASDIAVPLMAEGKPFGAVTIYASEIDAFGDEEIRLLSEMANDLAYGIIALRTESERKKADAEKAAREREVAIGFRIQQTLLLDEPPTDVAGLHVAALSVPSQRIAGDFYVFFPHNRETLDVIVADVMGKGIPAALLGAATKSQFTEALCHLVALSPAGALPEPREVVTLAASNMARQLIELESFVTLCYARLNMVWRCLDIVDCGHTGVIHLQGGTGQCQIVHGGNLPLGIRGDEIFDQIGIEFAAGDVFVFFSDGITEASSAAKEQFGADRLMDCVRASAPLGPDALVGAIRAAVVAFTGSDHLTDDLTCVAIEIGEQCRALAHEELEIGSNLRELRLARKFVRDFCGMPSMPWLDEERIARIELAVNEALSNIIRHAYHGRTDQRIQIKAEAFSDRVAVRLHHLGVSYDPRNAPLPSFDGSRESGFGVYLINKSVDHLRHYKNSRGGNCIAVVENR